MEKNNFEKTHNLYVVEDTKTDSSFTTTEVKHNIECLDKMLDSVDEALEALK